MPPDQYCQTVAIVPSLPLAAANVPSRMRWQIGISGISSPPVHVPPLRVAVRRIVGNDESHSPGSSTIQVAVTSEFGSLTSRTPCTV
jgi:hypothetical protein